MEATKGFIRYDGFKLVVALILLALLLILLFNQPTGEAADRSTAPASAAGTQSGLPVSGAPAANPTATKAAALPTATAAPAQPSATTAPAQPSATTAPSPTRPAPTPTVPPPTPTTAPTAAPTTAPTEAPTAAPAAAQASATPAPAAGASPSTAACAALPSRLSPGVKARVLTNLYFRSAAGMDAPIQRTHPVGTVLEVTGEPQCIAYGSGAYLWWPVKNAQGEQGWSAEGSVSGGSYFLEPAP